MPRGIPNRKKTVQRSMPEGVADEDLEPVNTKHSRKDIPKGSLHVRGNRTSSNPNTDDSEVPEGFEEVSGGKLDGWFIVEEDNTVQGFLLDSFETRGKFGKKRVYKIRISAGETRIMTSDGDEETVGDGSVIGLDEKGWLKGLADIERGREIWVKCLGKDGSGEKAPWKFKIAAVPF